MSANLAAAAGTNAWTQAISEARGQASLPEVIGWVVSVQLFAIVCYWITSKVLAGEAKSRFVNALKLWAFYILAAIVIGIIVGIGSFIIPPAQPTALIAVVLLLLLILVVVVGIPMKIYGIGVFRSIGFLLIAWILNAAAVLAVTQFLPHSAMAERIAAWNATSSELQTRMMHRWQTEPRTNREQSSSADDVIVADSTKPIAERHVALQRIYRDLETRRVNLKIGDQTALDAYNRDDARYRQLLEQLQAAAAAGG